MKTDRTNSAAVRISGPGLSLEEVTRLVPLAASVSHRAGEPRGRGLRWTHDVWHYDIPESRGSAKSLEEVVRALLTALEPHRETFAAIARRTTPVLWCACIGPGPEIGVELSTATLSRIASFAMELSVSTYVSSE